MLSNNDILKKLRVALSLRNDDIIEILSLVDFDISKGALAIFSGMKIIPVMLKLVTRYCAISSMA